VGRIQHFIKIYEDYGLLTELIAQSIYKVVPFLVIFLLWNCLFAMELYILKSNLSDVEGFKGIPTAIGYFFIAFENGIGNIASPSVDDWELTAETKFSARMVIYLVYIVWLFNQILLLVVLLNFVIALISQVYENVMDCKMVHVYTQKQQLNDEADRFYSVWNKLICFKNKVSKNID